MYYTHVLYMLHNIIYLNNKQIILTNIYFQNECEKMNYQNAYFIFMHE